MRCWHNKPSPTGRCTACDAYDRLKVGAEHGLTGGQWVNDHGIQRWVPGVTREEIVKEEYFHNVSTLLACPTCHAKADRMCTTSTGRSREPHANRLIHKVCSCGRALEPGKKLCQQCRTDSRRRTMREVKRRQRSRASIHHEDAEPCGRRLPPVGAARHDGNQDTTNKSALVKERQLRPGPRRPVKDTTD